MGWSAALRQEANRLACYRQRGTDPVVRVTQTPQVKKGIPLSYRCSRFTPSLP